MMQPSPNGLRSVGLRADTGGRRVFDSGSTLKGLRAGFSMLVGATLASGCSEADVRTTSLEFADSAGVRIALNHMQDPPHWEISREPVLDIGAVDGGPQEFFQVSDAARLSDGRLVVLNSGSRELRFFEEDGTFLSSFGRLGDGPGELRFPVTLFRLAGDSLAVWDAGSRRLSTFTLDGVFVRSASPAASNPTPLALLPDGRMVVTSERFDLSSGPEFRTMYTDLWIATADGELVQQLPSQRFGEFGFYGDIGLVGPPLFGAITSIAADDEGVWVGTGLGPEVQRYSLEGDLELIARWPEGDRNVTNRDIELALERELAGAPEEQTTRVRQIHAARPVSERFPSHGELRMDEFGMLWVQEYEQPGHQGPTRWRVFSEEGALEAVASVPEGHRILEVGSDYVLTVGTGALGLEHVRMFSLVRHR